MLLCELHTAMNCQRANQAVQAYQEASDQSSSVISGASHASISSNKYISKSLVAVPTQVVCSFVAVKKSQSSC